MTCGTLATLYSAWLGIVGDWVGVLLWPAVGLHAMCVNQLDPCKELQLVLSLFPMHTFYWGDWHDRILGPMATQKIAPMGSVLEKGMIGTSHADAPVALPKLFQVIWATGTLH